MWRFKDRLVSVVYLKDTQLWKMQSAEWFDFVHGGLYLSTVLYKYNQMLSYDDPTKSELEYLDGLSKTIMAFAPERGEF